MSDGHRLRCNWSDNTLVFKHQKGRGRCVLSGEHSICNDCGACCKHFRVSFYQGELDTFPGGRVPAELTQPVTPFLVCMNGTEKGNNNGQGRCTALQNNNRCSIYEDRPSPCREYAAYTEDGSLNPKCVQLRMQYNIGMPQPPLKAA